MSVVKAKIQTVEDMYLLIWTAVAKKQPIRAIYKDLPRFVFALTGWAAIVRVKVACSAISMAGRVKADWGQWGRRGIGVASFSRNCAEWNC